jgi:hypothetical protein
MNESRKVVETRTARWFSSRVTSLKPLTAAIAQLTAGIKGG